MSLHMIQPHESLPSIFRQFLERSEVQFNQQLSNRLVQFIQRCTNNTAPSTFALSFGRRGRAGNTAVW